MDYKKAYAGSEEYIGRGDGEPFATLWVVTVQQQSTTPQGVKRVAAYFSEKLARSHAASLVGGRDLIGLETIHVLDFPANNKL
jgi:hypothetical protein